MRILVVDDDRGILNALKASLASCGHEVFVADSGRRALEFLLNPQDEPSLMDLVLSDQRMPQMTGLELIKTIRKIRPELACILMTGYGNEALRQEIINLKRCRYLEKPFQTDHLLYLIEDWESDGQPPFSKVMVDEIGK
ncbi:MAG: response regulator [Thermodesulfobacteriota bacterium]